jgi:DNA repair protein RAD7
MSRRNNVRGPTSALTEFLKENNITPTTIATRAATQNQPQPVAGSSNAEQANVEDEAENPTRRKRRNRAAATSVNIFLISEELI